MFWCTPFPILYKFYFWLLMRCLKIVSRLLFYFHFSFTSIPTSTSALASVEISTNDTKRGVIDWSSKCWDSFKVTVWPWLGHLTALVCSFLISIMRGVYSFITQVFIRHILYGSHCAKCRKNLQRARVEVPPLMTCTF